MAQIECSKRKLNTLYPPAIILDAIQHYVLKYFPNEKKNKSTYRGNIGNMKTS